MKIVLIALSVVTSVTLVAQQAPPAGAETPRTNAAPRREITPPVVSPEVRRDRTVTFRLRAPAAKEVKVSGEWPGGATALTKDAGGLWSATVGPLEPDIYGYSFNLDGFQMLDPGNSWVKPMRSPRTSVFEVPGDPPRLSEFLEVPHGTVRMHEYQSKSLGLKRRLHVYTPPGYEQNSKRYPVLYLLHGSGDNDATWISVGRAHSIADNLFVQKKAAPMIIVMTDGHAAFASGAGANATNAAGRNVAAYQDDLLGDVIPLVEISYRVRKDRANRAIIGLSMGGGQSLTIGLNHPELFAWVGGMSSSLRTPETTVAAALADPKQTNKNLKLLWFACGKDDGLVISARQFDAVLTQKEIRHEFLETEGNHSWPVWRRYLGDFMPRLFVETK